MSLNISDLQVYSTEIQSATTEVLRENVELFNQSSLGGIILSTGDERGHYSKTAFFKKASGLIQERDVTDSSSTISPVKVTQGEQIRVKFDLTNYFEITPNHLFRAGNSAGNYIAAVAAQSAKEMFQAYLNRSISATIANLSKAGSPVLTDISAASGDTPTAANYISWRALMSAASKFGDASSDIVAWVMDSSAWFELLDSNLANANSLFSFGSVNVYADPVGRPIIITDNASLTSGANGFAIGLTAGAAEVEQQPVRPTDTASSQDLGNKDAIRYAYRTDYSAILGVKGFSWTPATPSPSPSVVEIGTAANWSKIATSEKDLAGVVLKFTYKV